MGDLSRIGDVVEINGRRTVVTDEGARLAGLKREELLKLREDGRLPESLVFELQAAVRAVLGRCASTQTQDGLPCRHWPRAGAILCPTHGGRIPAHLARAERLLSSIRLPALEWLAREIDRASEDACHECGYPRQGIKERKYIASLVWRLLDRAGLPPTKKLEVSTSAEKDITLDGWTREEKLELGGYLQKAKELKTRVEARLLNEEAAKTLAIPAVLVPAQLIEAAQGKLGPRPAEEDLDPLEE